MDSLYKLSFQCRDFTLAIIKSFKDEQSAISFGLSYAKKHDYELTGIEQIWYSESSLRHQYNKWKFKKQKER